MAYFNRPEKAAINRPLLSWDRPLGNAGWRRWFDTVLNAGVTGFGGGRARGASAPMQQGLAIDALLGEPYTGPVDPRFTDPMGAAAQEDALRRQTGTGKYAESHEQFLKRYGR